MAWNCLKYWPQILSIFSLSALSPLGQRLASESPLFAIHFVSVCALIDGELCDGELKAGDPRAACPCACPFGKPMPLRCPSIINDFSKVFATFYATSSGPLGSPLSVLQYFVSFWSSGLLVLLPMLLLAYCWLFFYLVSVNFVALYCCVPFDFRFWISASSHGFISRQLQVHLPDLVASVSATVSDSDSVAGSLFGQRITLICPVSVSVSPGQHGCRSLHPCCCNFRFRIFSTHRPPVHQPFPLLDKYLSISY